MDFRRKIGLSGGMDDRTDLVLVLLSVAGGMLEDAAALAPLVGEKDLVHQIDTIDAHIENARSIIKSARVIAFSDYQK